MHSRENRLLLPLLCFILNFSSSISFQTATLPGPQICTLRLVTTHLQPVRKHPAESAHRQGSQCSTVSRLQQDSSREKEEETDEGVDAVKAPLALLFLSQFLLFIGVGAVIPAIPLYGQEIGLSQASNGIVISAPAVAMLIGSKFSGNFADVARKPAMLIGMAVITVSDMGTAFATSLASLVVARLGLGVGRILAESGERGMLADLAGQVPSLRGRALAAQSALLALGIAIGAPLGGVVLEMYGPRASFLCVSAGAFVALVLYSFLPETVPKADDGSLSTATNQEEASNDWPQLLTDPRWRGIALCQCGLSVGYATKIASIPILATNVLPGGAIGAGSLLSLAGLSGLVGAPVGGWLTDRVGARFVVAASGILSGVGLLLIPLALGADLSWASTDIVIPGADVVLSPKAISFAALVLVWSLGASALGPSLTALAQELAPVGAEATALALPRAAGDGTYIVTPFLLGSIADATAITGVDCGIAGVAAIVGVLVLLLTVPTRGIVQQQN